MVEAFIELDFAGKLGKVLAPSVSDQLSESLVNQLFFRSRAAHGEGPFEQLIIDVDVSPHTTIIHKRCASDTQSM